MGYFASSSASEGALLVGAHDAAGDFTYCGTISVGFTDRARRDLSSQLVPWRQEHSPFSSHDLVVDRRRLCWVKPVIVGRIEFREFTGRLRHAAWKGVVDVDAQDVRVPSGS